MRSRFPRILVFSKPKPNQRAGMGIDLADLWEARGSSLQSAGIKNEVSILEVDVAFTFTNFGKPLQAHTRQGNRHFIHVCWCWSCAGQLQLPVMCERVCARLMCRSCAEFWGTVRVRAPVRCASYIHLKFKV